MCIGSFPREHTLYVSVRFELPSSQIARREQRRQQRSIASESSFAGTPASSSYSGELAGALERIIFEPGKMGITFVTTGQVTIVDAGGQGERLGVKPGWHVINVDGKPWTWEAFRSFISGQRPYTVVFRTA